MAFKRIFVIFCAVVALCSIGYGFYHRTQAARLQTSLGEAAGKLQQQLGTAITELEQTRAALDRSEQSVEQLTLVDQRRDAGISESTECSTMLEKLLAELQAENKEQELLWMQSQ